jgi:glycolate oxidase FAD binding subunit
LYGSLGTLGLIAEVVLRLHPLPESSATVVVPSSVQEATARSLALLAGPLEPAAVDWVGDPRGGGPPGRLAVLFEGTAAGVAAQTAALREQLDGAAPQALADADEAALWREYAHAHLPESGQSTAFVGTLPSRLTDVATALAGAADAAGVDVSLASHAALGLHTARFCGPPAQQAAALDQWRRDIVAVGGTVVLRERPAEVDAEIDPLGPTPSSVGLLRAIKARLDPDGRCAPGRLAPWL